MQISLKSKAMSGMMLNLKLGEIQAMIAGDDLDTGMHQISAVDPQATCLYLQYTSCMPT